MQNKQSILLSLAIRRRKANWIVHILPRNCLLNHVKGKEKGREDEEKDKHIRSLLGFYAA
jgi:hypothetical protein